jgi:hypothetical protein
VPGIQDISGYLTRLTEITLNLRSRVVVGSKKQIIPRRGGTQRKQNEARASDSWQLVTNQPTTLFFFVGNYVSTGRRHGDMTCGLDSAICGVFFSIGDFPFTTVTTVEKNDCGLTGSRNKDQNDCGMEISYD